MAEQAQVQKTDSHRNEKIGNVVSTKMAKTIVVEVVMRGKDRNQTDSPPPNLREDRPGVRAVDHPGRRCRRIDEQVGVVVRELRDRDDIHVEPSPPPEGSCATLLRNGRHSLLPLPRVARAGRGAPRGRADRRA